jgi:transposase-like protein
MATKTKIPQFQNDDEARAFLESVRWPNGPICPHCGSVGGWPIKTKDHVRKDGRVQKARQGLYKCAEYKCGEQFSVTVGTVFERSKIPLTKWLQAVALMCSSKKGISSHQLHRMLDLQYKTAWFLSHRIREAMKDRGSVLLGGPGTSGIVEADETYFGKVKGHGKGGHGSKKQKVVALVERKGKVRAFHVATVTAESLAPVLKGHIAESARLMTDSAPLYNEIGGHFASHETVNHMIKEYVRGDVTTNTVEGFFGILKRGIGGIYQHVSPAHLHRYVNEFAFRYNHRAALGTDDGQRTIDTLHGIGGKRLMYRNVD